MISNQFFDELTSASSGTLEVGRVKAELPSKFATTSELNASRRIELKGLPGEVVVSAKLIFPNSLKKLLTEDTFLKDFARRLSKESASAGEVVRLLYLSFRGLIGISRADDLKTILDLQYFSDFDVITVQQTLGVSPEDFVALLNFASRWMEQRGVDKPLMPILLAMDNRENFEKYLNSLMKRGISCLGIDMRGGFHYHALRTLEDLKKSNPQIWIHALQVPPKIRFGRKLLPCSQGMMLPLFGIDSFSRWVVPPPPEPLTKDKINLFDRIGWGALKRKEFISLRGTKLGCDCPVCQDQNLDGFYTGRVLTVLSKSKVHDHFAQQAELRNSVKHIKEKTYKRFLASKEFPKKFLDEFFEPRSR